MSNADDEAKALMLHSLMEETKAYLERGRVFARTGVEELEEKWIRAFRNWAASGHGGGTRLMDDLAAKLRLQNLEPPYAAVKAEIADMKAAIVKAGGDSPGVRAKIADFRRRREEETKQ
jgi:hypothetical protein